MGFIEIYRDLKEITEVLYRFMMFHMVFRCFSMGMFSCLSYSKEV